MNHNILKYSILLLWFGLFGSQLFAKTNITDARVSHYDGKTRLVLSLDRAFYYNQFKLINPHRLVIDINNASLKTNLKKANVSKSLISKLRYGDKGDKIRLVIDLKKDVNSKIFALPENKSGKHRLVVDIMQKNVVKKKQAKKTSPVLISSTKYTTRKVVVVIDPGHGGKDPGAVGVKRTSEKKVVLAIALELKKLIDKEPGMRAILTRKGDYYVALRKRLKLARKDFGDVFISIHADAYKNSSYSGSSVYILSEKAASKEASRWLASKNRYSDLGGVDLSDKGKTLRSVLIDLSQTATIGNSYNLGKSVLKELGETTHIHRNTVELAPFVVLKSPDIPSLLIETGFISNRQEELKLRSPRHQKKLARAIMQGLRSYFWEHPPLGTWIAKQKKLVTYRVKSGDSLIAIADELGVPLESLKNYNAISDDNIIVGQLLKVPDTQSA